jgi:hypothetical protein
VTEWPQAEDADTPVLFMCSGCHTPTPVADGHVIPGWNAGVRRIFTSYRCSNCWLHGLAATRAAVETGEADVLSAFCDFMEVQGYKTDAAKLRTMPAQEQQTVFYQILDAVARGVEAFQP